VQRVHGLPNGGVSRCGHGHGSLVPYSRGFYVGRPSAWPACHGCIMPPEVAMTDPRPAFNLEDFVRVESSDTPVFDDSGRWMAFRSNRSGVWQAWLCDLESETLEVTALTDTGGVIYDLAMRPGHRELLYVADDGGDEQYQFHLLDLDTRAGRVIASRPRVIHGLGAWYADGRLLSYAS